MVEKKEGATMTCLNCQTDLICRLKDYGGDYKPKLQWQNFDGTAHYKTNDGKNFECVIPTEDEKDTSANAPTATTSEDYLKEKQSELQNKITSTYSLTDGLKKHIKEETIRLYLVDQEITNTLKNFLGEPSPNGAQVGKFSNHIIDTLKESHETIGFTEIKKEPKDPEKYCVCKNSIPNAMTDGKTCQICLKLREEEK